MCPLGRSTAACCALVEIGDSKRAYELKLAGAGLTHDTKFVCTRELIEKTVMDVSADGYTLPKLQAPLIYLVANGSESRSRTRWLIGSLRSYTDKRGCGAGGCSPLAALSWQRPEIAGTRPGSPYTRPCVSRRAARVVGWG